MFDFKTIKNPVEDILYKEKSSKFIGYMYPVESQEQIKFHIDHLKQKHPLATHICFAFRLGNNGQNYRANDDGEPNATAGIPILNRLISNDLTNIILFIVRYFGGTKLGVSGLISTYKNSAEQTISNAEIITKTLIENYIIIIPFEFLSKIMSIIEKNKINIINKQYSDKVIFNIEIPIKNKEEILNKLRNINHNINIQKDE